MHSQSLAAALPLPSLSLLISFAFCRLGTLHAGRQLLLLHFSQDSYFLLLLLVLALVVLLVPLSVRALVFCCHLPFLSSLPLLFSLSSLSTSISISSCIQ